MIKNIFKAIGCLSLVITAFNPVLAQENQTSASVAKQKMQNIWLNNTNNAAAGVVDAPQLYSITDLGYGITKGDFKYVQQGDDNTQVMFHTEGGGIYENLKNMFLWGEFSFQRDKIEGARFNASMYDPLRDMPFFLADSTSAKWINQEYNVKMKASTPKLFNFLTLGATASYKAGQGAKQIDPRPLMRVSKFDVGVSALFELGEHNFIGLNYDYYSRREDGNATNTNNSSAPTCWEFVAPGFFRSGIIDYYSSIITTRYYHVNAMGGGLQYGFKNDHWNILLAGSYMQRVEDVTSEYLDGGCGNDQGDIPLKMIGTVKEDVWNGKLVANYTFNNGNMLSLNASYEDKSVDGIEYFQTFDNTYEVQKWIVNAKYTRSNKSKVATDIKLDYIVNDGNVYKWWFGVNYNTKTNDWVYYSHNSTQDIKNNYFGAFISRHIKMGDNNSLTINLNGGFSSNADAALNYTGAGTQPEDPAWTMFTLKDFNFLASDFTKFGGDITYSFSGFKSESMSMFFTVALDYISPDSSEFDKRTFTNFKVGVAF